MSRVESEQLACGLTPLSYGEFFDDIHAMRAGDPGFLDTEEWAKMKLEDVLFLIQDGSDWSFACSDDIEDYKLYTNFNYFN